MYWMPCIRYHVSDIKLNLALRYSLKRYTLFLGGGLVRQVAV